MNFYRISDTDTPSTMDMEDGDTIEVFTQQSGGKRERRKRTWRLCFVDNCVQKKITNVHLVN